MGGDLVGAGYPTAYPLTSLLGGLSNIVQPNEPARSNLEYFGAGNLVDGALASTGVGCFVPVPVSLGQVISKVSILVGGTGASTPTHQFAALYAGTGTAPALMGQSTDTTTAVIAASALYGWTLATAQLITSTNAPLGFVYALVAITASAIPTAATIATPAGINYQWSGTAGAGSPLFLSGTAGSALAGTAAATIASGAAKAVSPIVVLQ